MQCILHIYCETSVRLMQRMMLIISLLMSRSLFIPYNFLLPDNPLATPESLGEIVGMLLVSIR